MNRQQVYTSIQESFSILSNPLRFEIFIKILKEGCDCDINTQKGFTGNCVTSIVEGMKLPQSTVSTYIKDLRNAGLIDCKKNGKFVHCKPNKENLITVKAFIDGVIGQIKE